VIIRASQGVDQNKTTRGKKHIGKKAEHTDVTTREKRHGPKYVGGNSVCTQKRTAQTHRKREWEGGCVGD